MNQCEKIVLYIQKLGSISSMEAFQDFGITRLSERIYELREEGYKFKETFETSKKSVRREHVLQTVQVSKRNRNRQNALT